MREYGDGVEPTRALLRTYVAAAIADTWPDEPRPTGAYPTHIKTFVPGSIEGEELSALLSAGSTMPSAASSRPTNFTNSSPIC